MSARSRQALLVDLAGTLALARVGATTTARPVEQVARLKKPRVVLRPEIDDGAARARRTREQARRAHGPWNLLHTSA